MSYKRPIKGRIKWSPRVPESGAGDFRIGSQVVVRESQTAVFYRDGKALDTFGPGRHTITTANIPLLINLVQLGTGGQTPFTAEVYFVNMRDFIDMKWGTPEPISVRDKDLGLARLRANGRYSMAITEPQMFVTKIVGAQGLYRTSDIADYLRGIVISRLTDLLGESKAGLFDLPGLFDEMNAATRVKVAEDFAALGITMKAMFIQSISPTEETAKAIDERSSMGAIGDMQKYMQFQAARDERGGQERRRGGQRDGHGRGAWRGRGLGASMASMMSQAMQPQQAAPAAAAGAGAAATPEVMNLNEAAAYLKVSPQDIQGLITSGQVKAKQIGSEYRISKKALDDFLAS